jgi:hypothetical protein
MLIEAMTKPTEYICHNYSFDDVRGLIFFLYMSNIYKFEPTNLRDKKIIEHVIDDALLIIGRYRSILELIGDNKCKETLIIEFINNFKYITSLDCASGVFIEARSLICYINLLKTNNYDINEQIISLIDHGIRCNDYSMMFNK